MKWRVDHTFTGVTLADYEEVYFSSAFNDACVAAIGLASRTIVVDQVQPNGDRHRRTKLVPQVALPAAIAKFVRLDQIHYDEVADFSAADHALQFRIDSAATERVKVSGTIRFTVVSPTSVRRVLDGVIAVEAPFGVGAVVETFIESEVQKSYDKLSRFCQRYLDDRMRSSP
jgi:Protein of unknown function (DUF2505)